MFEIGWTEMLVIAVVMIVVVGPKDLPKMLRTFGKTATKLRSMAGDFQKQFNEALKEAELDDVKKSIEFAEEPQSGERDQEAAQSVREGGLRHPRRRRRGDEAEACRSGRAGGRGRRAAEERRHGGSPFDRDAQRCACRSVLRRCHPRSGSARSRSSRQGGSARCCGGCAKSRQAEGRPDSGKISGKAGGRKAPGCAEEEET